MAMIPLAVPNLTGNEKKYLDNCINTTFVSSVGEYVTEFERMVAKTTESIDAVATSSGTTGIHVALTSIGVNHGDIVIVPTFTFIASANAVCHCGAIPWLMDINTADWCIDPNIVRDEIRCHCEKRRDGQLFHKETDRRIAAIMPVYTLGNIPNMNEFRRIADQYNLPLVADSACAIGATYNGCNLGNLADLSIISFNGNKTITCGGGGAVIGNNKEKLDHVRHLSTTARVWPDYDFDEIGFNYRMTNIQAAVGVAQMEKLQIFVEKKKSIRRVYEERLGDLERSGVGFFPTSDGGSCWFSGLVLPESYSLEGTKNICAQLKEKGVEARMFWKPVHLQCPYKDCPRSSVNVSEGLWERIITLPCSTGITDEELNTVIEIVRETIRATV